MNDTAAPALDSSSVARHREAPPGPEEALASEVAQAMAIAWRNGERPKVEDLLLLHPGLASAPRAVLRLISEELCLRQEAGESPRVEEFLGRFPQWRAELELLLACHDLFEAPPAPLDFPRPGERCGEFELLRELGRGSQGRVFLATQPSLCDRLVVVKLTALEVTEHLSLARLQHTGIVPLYLAHDLADRGLRLLCMPFMGGVSLATVLTAMDDVAVPRRTGKTITDALASRQIQAPGGPPLGGPALEFLGRAGYVQAVCWIGACLAEALHYAHQRGLMHFDLKPSNLLLAGDGQAMLLDFHLARGPINPGRAAPEWIGGTPQYMPPEQAAALAAVREGRPIEVVVDARADVYSLGMVLYEMLAGQAASSGEGLHGLRRLNRQVTRGLNDVLAKCLSPRASDRYADSQALAEDLRRHLADLPLRGVVNRSPLELWRKWRRRRPHAAPRVIGSALILAALAGMGWFWAAQRIEQSRHALVDGQQLLDRHGYTEAIDRLEAAIDALQPVPWAAALKRTLREQLVIARRAKLAHELHQFAQRLRFLDGGAAIDGHMLRTVEQTCHTFWAARHRLLQGEEAASSAVGAEVRADLVDLVMFWLDVQSRLPESNPSGTVQRASELLDQAEAGLGPHQVFHRERQLLLGGGEHMATADGGSSRSPATGQRYALGRLFVRLGDDRRALDEFRRAVSDGPQEFWANYHRGRCAYRLELHDEALNAFCVCVALAPSEAECYYNRALVHTALGQPAEALFDYDRALQLDPALAPAALNRELLRRQTRN